MKKPRPTPGPDRTRSARPACAGRAFFIQSARTPPCLRFAVTAEDQRARPGHGCLRTARRDDHPDLAEIEIALDHQLREPGKRQHDGRVVQARFDQGFHHRLHLAMRDLMEWILGIGRLRINSANAKSLVSRREQSAAACRTRASGGRQRCATVRRPASKPRRAAFRRKPATLRPARNARRAPDNGPDRSAPAPGNRPP